MNCKQYSSDNRVERPFSVRRAAGSEFCLARNETVRSGPLTSPVFIRRPPLRPLPRDRRRSRPFRTGVRVIRMRRPERNPNLSDGRLIETGRRFRVALGSCTRRSRLLAEIAAVLH